MITNYFSPLEFVVTIKRMPNVQFSVQKTAIPNISGNPAMMPTPFNRLNFVPDKLSYSPLDMSFIVDEAMSNYIEVLNWIKGSTAPERYQQYSDLAKSEHGIQSDITIVALNSHKNPIIKIDFINCTPTNLSAVMLDTTSTDIIYPEATVTFVYDYFNISPYTD